MELIFAFINAVTMKPCERLGFHPCEQVRGNKYGIRRICGDKRADVRKFYILYIRGWKISAVYAVLKPSLSLPLLLIPPH